MSIRLAAGKPLAPLCCERSLQWRMRRGACNDNGGDVTADALLQASLRHFGRHGLAAAQTALAEAELAAERGDTGGAALWRDICQMLDRRLAISRGSDTVKGTNKAI